MVFSSITFLFVFLPVTLLLYYAVKNITWKNIILLITSLIFYAWGEPVYVILMLISILFNYYIGLDIDRNKKKYILVMGIIVNLIILGYFKYSGFLVQIINKVFSTSIENRKLALPVGISFYTFQAMSYIIDVYRGENKAQKNILPFAVYITMFPQLIAGPIVRYSDIEKQLNSRTFYGADFKRGVVLFVKGLMKKVVLANCIGALHTEILMDATRTSVMAWIGALAYTLQIFNDFSGYSDMAIGLGLMLGFKFPKNFDRPYAAQSVTEFWRRWHISLSTWFREYVYIPLGGNKKGVARQILNLLIVWGLTGLWHGAAWNFVAWGLYYGVLLILEKFVFKNFLKKLPSFVNWIVTFVIVIVGWVFFFSNSLHEAAGFLKTMFANRVFSDYRTLSYIAEYGVLFIVGFVFSIIKDDCAENRKISPIRMTLTVIYFVISIVFLVSQSYNPFLYFRF